jgi:linoleoyl-CoA desaturase
MYLKRGRAGRSPVRPPKGGALLTLIAGKVVFVLWAVVIPLLNHPVLPVLVFFLVASFVASLALALVFQLSHCVVETACVDPAQHAPSRPWQIHQIETTVDFARSNTLLHLYAGGLNYQIEHHLYSRLPHTLYPRLAPIVEAAAQAHGITYTYHPTLRKALRSHTRWLKLLGAPTTSDVAAQI